MYIFICIRIILFPAPPLECVYFQRKRTHSHPNFEHSNASPPFLTATIKRGASKNIYIYIYICIHINIFVNVCTCIFRFKHAFGRKIR